MRGSGNSDGQCTAPGWKFGRAAQSLVLVVALALAGCQTTQGGGAAPGVSPFNVGTGSGLASYKQRKLSGISPYAQARRWESYTVISDLAERLWRNSRSSATIASGRVATFSEFPLLVLEDRDNDRQAEFYAYRRRAGADDTLEFGAYFDLGGDGQPDWIVFNGGPMFTKGLKEFFWFTHQAVDRDGDGRFDVRIFNAIDMDGDGFSEKDATAWIYDDDGDGLADRAEHIVDGRATPIRPEAGRLPLRHVLHQTPEEEPRLGGRMGAGLFDTILRDILSLTRR